MEVNNNSVIQNEEKAVCYVRLSQDDSTNPSLSPMNQEKICKEYANSKGDKIAVVYRDINKSGTNLERSGFQTMMEDARKGLFKRIYVKMWDRLSRDLIDMELTIKKLAQLGIIIVSSDGHNDPKERQVRALLSQWQIDDMREKTEMTHKLRLQEKIPLNPPPFGYHMSKKYKMFMPDGEKAEKVKEIFEMRLASATIKEIADEYSMNTTTVYNILKNRTYLGENLYRGNWSKGKHQPLITEEVFLKCQKQNSRAGTWCNNSNNKSKEIVN